MERADRQMPLKVGPSAGPHLNRMGEAGMLTVDGLDEEIVVADKATRPRKAKLHGSARRVLLDDVADGTVPSPCAYSQRALEASSRPALSRPDGVARAAEIVKITANL